MKGEHRKYKKHIMQRETWSVSFKQFIKDLQSSDTFNFYWFCSLEQAGLYFPLVCCTVCQISFHRLWPKIVYFICWPPFWIYRPLTGCLRSGRSETPSLCLTSFAASASHFWGGTLWEPVPGWHFSAGGWRSSCLEWLHLLGQSYTWQRRDLRRLATRWANLK